MAWTTDSKLVTYSTVAVSVLGIVLNVLVFWVWSARHKFHGLVFLFQCLAVADISFIGLRNVWRLSESGSVLQQSAKILTGSSQVAIVVISLMIGGLHWSSTTQHCRSCVERRPARVKLATAVVVCLSVAMNVTQEVWTLAMSQDMQATMISLAISTTLLTLPCLALVVQVVSLLWKARPVHRVSLNVPSSSWTSRSSRHQELTYAIAVLAFSVFVAVPVGQLIMTLFSLTTAPRDVSAWQMGTSIVLFMQIFNASLPFLVYVAVIQKFLKDFLIQVYAFYTSRYHATIDSINRVWLLVNNRSESDTSLRSGQHQNHQYAIVMEGELGALMVWDIARNKECEPPAIMTMSSSDQHSGMDTVNTPQHQVKETRKIRFFTEVATEQGSRRHYMTPDKPAQHSENLEVVDLEDTEMATPAQDSQTLEVADYRIRDGHSGPAQQNA